MFKTKYIPVDDFKTICDLADAKFTPAWVNSKSFVDAKIEGATVRMTVHLVEPANGYWWFSSSGTHVKVEYNNDVYRPEVSNMTITGRGSRDYTRRDVIAQTLIDLFEIA